MIVIPTGVLVFVVTLCTIGSQIILKRGVNDIVSILKNDGAVAFVLAAASSPIVIGALSLQGIGYVIWLFVVAQERLSIAFAMSGSFFYLTMALVSWIIYDERLIPLQWIGLVLISLGVVLVTAGEAMASR
jgi:drug/metabolite transporter (DMT)-like permease